MSSINVIWQIIPPSWACLCFCFCFISLFCACGSWCKIYHKCSCHTKQMKRSWFVSVGQMIHTSWCFFVCICVLFLLVPLCARVLLFVLCFAFACMCVCAFVCVFVLPIQEWICVCRADDLSKLMLVHSVEALKREELSLGHFLYVRTKLGTEDLRENSFSCSTNTNTNWRKNQLTSSSLQSEPASVSSFEHTWTQRRWKRIYPI